jgi:hypothetical protein
MLSIVRRVLVPPNGTLCGRSEAGSPPAADHRHLRAHRGHGDHSQRIDRHVVQRLAPFRLCDLLINGGTGKKRPCLRDGTPSST